MTLRTLLLIGTLWGFLAGPAVAQIRGEVRAPTGEPVAEVLVELWTPEGRGPVQLTDELGLFSFSETQAAEVTGASFSRLGFASVMERVTPGADPLVVILEPTPIPLPELVVEAAGEVCPNREDPEARKLWEAGRSRYSPATAERGIAMRLLWGEEAQVPGMWVGIIDEDRLRYRDHRQVGATDESTPGRYRNVNATIEESGYVVRTHLARPRWRFRSLEGQHAHHFASGVFGDRHALSLHAVDDSRFALAFCPGDRGPSGIEGVLVLSRDTAFVSARWNYVIPDRSEVAGGEVLFVPWWNPRDELPHLLSARGVFWRSDAVGRDRYFQRSSVFSAWSISEDEEMPSLPPR